MTMRHRATIYIDCDAMEFGIEPRVREIADFSRQVQMTAKTSAQRVAALRAARDALGLKRLELYVHPEDLPAIKALAEKLQRIMTGRENMREAVETRIMRANAKAWVIDGEDRRECREWVKDRYIWRDPMRQLMKAEAQSEDE